MYTFHAAGSIQRLQPSLLAALTSDLQTTSRRLLDLRELLPAANVSALVARRPQLLLQDTADVKAAVAALQRLLPLGGEHQVDRWVPFYLNACRTIWPYSPHTVCPPTPYPPSRSLLCQGQAVGCSHGLEGQLVARPEVE